jgi:hypothetical protein
LRFVSRAPFSADGGALFFTQKWKLFPFSASFLIGAIVSPLRLFRQEAA